MAVLEDTNDIALSAVRVADGFGVPPGVYFRLGLGGITGHRDFARDTGVIVAPDDAVRVVPPSSACSSPKATAPTGPRPD